MHPNSLFSIRHWTLPEILFVAAACFAIGAVGFFVAVYLQLNTFGSSSDRSANGASIDDKVRVMNILAQSASNPTETTSNIKPTESQAAADDVLAAQKLKMLEKLNTQ